MTTMKMAVAAVAVVVGAAALFPAGGAGGVAGTVEAWARGATGGWTEDACRKAPEPCLKARAASLEKAKAAIEGAVDALRGQVERVAAIVREREVVVGQNDLLLREGRNLLAQATDTAKPIPFVGRTYSINEFKAQLSILFRERQSLDAVLGSARGQHEAIRKRLDDLMVSRGEVRSALALIPAQIEIVRANGILADVSGAMASIDGTLLSTERNVSDLKSLLGTTEDLMRSAQASATQPSGQSQAFKDFLNTGKL